MNFTYLRAITCLTTLILHIETIAAQPDTRSTSHTIVPGYERFRAEALTPVDAGRLLISEMNCQSCHGRAAAEVLPQRKAPVLTDVASRVQIEHLQAFIADPQKVKPGTAMPNVLSGEDAESSALALAHFLGSGGVTVPTPVADAAVQRGEQRFHAFGCAACHGDLRKPADERPDFVMPLGPVDHKYTIGSLMAFLQNPHAVRPSGRMPSLNLNDEEARDIASYLLQDIEVEPNLTVEVFNGDWNNIPDFDALKPESSGPASDFSVTATGKKERFGLRFRAWLHVPTDGEYKFWLGSDDGSRLKIDGDDIVNVDGIHPHQTKEGQRTLERGPHPVVVEYFEKGGEESLKVEIAGPGISRQPLAGMVSNSAEPPEESRAFQPDPELVTKGKRLFSTLGCASCHEHEKLRDTPTAGRRIPQFANMKSSGGCLSGTPQAGIPRFSLTEQQRADISAALSAFSAAPVTSRPAGETAIREVMFSLNCFACHERGKVGGVPRIHDHLFTGSIPEMGDEGRVPPHLNGVGDKLQESWLREVLNNGAKDRPYMATRMPKFGTQNVGDLIAAFARTDQKTEVPKVEFDEPPHRVKSSARYLIGDQSLSCIKCHYFGKHKATGIQSLDMTTMTTRLRRDWFHRYLIKPQAFRPGTRMPGSWPKGRSIVRKVLHGDSAQQIEAIWLYLSEGAKARLPSGLVAKSIELKPVDRPIIYRNFIQGLSARGIAVGFPEQAHYAWDAEQMNLRLIWHHEFIDAAKHWVGRGPGFQTPLGDHLMELVSGQPLAVLAQPDQSWPGESARAAGYQFRGYRLNEKGQPTFHYAWNDIHAEDFIEPREGAQDAAFVRTISLTAERPVSGLHMRLAAGGSIEKRDDGWLLDGAVLLQVQENGENAVVRDSGGRRELIIPVSFDDGGRSVVKYRMIW